MNEILEEPSSALNHLNNKFSKIASHEKSMRLIPSVGREIPVKLNGTLWCIAVLFNTKEDSTSSRSKNFTRFARRIREAGIPLLIVEGSCTNTKSSHLETECDKLIQVKSCPILWQKESLIRIGLENLPNSCDKVIWADADILLSGTNWKNEISQKLEKFKFLQPFSYAIFTPQSKDHTVLAPQSFENDFVSPSSIFVAQTKNENPVNFHYTPPFRHYPSTGHIWAGRKDALLELGLYEKAIVGGADSLFAEGLLFGADAPYLNFLSSFYKKDAKKYCDKLLKTHQGSVSYLDGVLYHLWHGSIKSRQYLKRLSILSKHNYNPDIDVKKTEKGLLEWASDKKELHADIANYLTTRAKNSN